eukprot:m.239641 g.239641  ORF g.239641 m.239641 type:complete len:613 (+) comp13510_c0_seq1:34-1872(+)
MATTSDNTVRVTLTPIQTAGRTEMTRELNLTYTQKVGRSVPQKAKPAPDNAIFDSKVLSRTHAEIWHDSGKVYVKDTKSSNGTYLNDDRLSPSGCESEPRELCTGDRLQLGVDVLENNTVAHKCVQFYVTVSVPQATKAAILFDPPSLPVENEVSLSTLASAGEEAMCNEIRRLRSESLQLHDLLESLRNQLTEARAQETQLTTQLKQLGTILGSIEQHGDVAREASQHHDKLISRIDSLESQIAFFTNRAARREGRDAELAALRAALLKTEKDHQMYEAAAKENIRRTMQEKHEIMEAYYVLKQQQSVASTTFEQRLASLRDELAAARTRETALREQLVETKSALVESDRKNRSPGSVETPATASTNPFAETLAQAMAATIAQSDQATEQVAGAGAELEARAEKLAADVESWQARTAAAEERLAQAELRVAAADGRVAQSEELVATKLHEIERLAGQITALQAELEAARGDHAAAAAGAAQAEAARHECEAAADKALACLRQQTAREMKLKQDEIAALKRRVEEAEAEAVRVGTLQAADKAADAPSPPLVTTHARGHGHSHGPNDHSHEHASVAARPAAPSSSSSKSFSVSLIAAAFAIVVAAAAVVIRRS